MELPSSPPRGCTDLYLPATRRPRPLTIAAWVVLAAFASQAAIAASAADKARNLTTQATKLYQSGKYEAALRKLAEALKAVPGHAPAAQIAAACNQRLGRLDMALLHYQTVQRASRPPLPADASDSAIKGRRLLELCEATIMLETNRARLRRSLAPLLADPRLALVARGHSDEMRDLGYFDHTSPTPGLETIRERFVQVFPEVTSYCIGENIARRYAEGLYSLCTDSIIETVEQWMDSPGHRANILRADYTHLGVGIAANSNGDYWATQSFARFSAPR